MKYARLKGNGQLEHAPNELQIEDYDITNPTHEDYLNAGYKEYIQTSHENRNWYIPVPKYSGNEIQIIQEWDYEKVPKPDYATLVEQRIATKIEIDGVTKGGYSIGAEIALNRKPDNHPDKVTYLEWVEESKLWAEEQIREWEKA
ncbi:MAG: hypothetical protein FWC34_01320 [Bacteroidetes bacterium]|nr:hypothetical protein [Bacteroidota bacterium]